MTRPIAAHYKLAQEMIAARRWTVDAAVGRVLGVRGQPFRRLNSWGYVQIKFRRPDDWQREVAVLAHRVIWEFVKGAPLPDGLVINHRNGVKTDNRLANLEAVSAHENAQHAFRTGLNQPNRATAKLTEADVRAIMGQPDVPAAHLAEQYGVDRTTINGIRNGWSWNHITGIPQARTVA